MLPAGRGQTRPAPAGVRSDAMRAAAFFAYGPAEVLRYAEVADPQIGPQDVLVITVPGP